MLAIVMGLETWRLGGEASLERIFTSGGFRRGAPLIFRPNWKNFFEIAPPPLPLSEGLDLPLLTAWLCGWKVRATFVMYVNFLFCVAILNFYDVVWFELLETFRFQDKDDHKGEVFSILSSACAWTSVILAGKCDSLRNCTTGGGKKVNKCWNCYHYAINRANFSEKKYNGAFGGVYFLRIPEKKTLP